MITKNKMLLDDIYETHSRLVGFKEPIPDHIQDNLKHALRSYQKEAIGRYLFYQDEDRSRDRSCAPRLLFNMATGSGKTLVMAALMLDLYKRGYNKIIFFVHTNNILEKTRDNLLEPTSSKYLFADKIAIDGRNVQVREVSDFSDARPDAMNLMFTTIQGLHSSLRQPRENAISYEDLESHDIVLLSDEAHHLQKATRSKDEEAAALSWESTTRKILDRNPRNVLLEFTATIDLDEPEILNKYRDRVLYRYDLRAFREDGFSKDVWIFEVSADLMDRAIQALMISQFRKKVAASNGIFLKPVVLFKSFRLADSNYFYTEFVSKIQSLTKEDLDRQRTTASGILADAFQFFDSTAVSMSDLAEELTTDFSVERLISVAKKSISLDDQQKLNSLEERENEIRAVFAVDVLDEGWDVLNLFDIVRLYDKRDSKNGKAGKTTLREAQLIGRGARYFPFIVGGQEEDRFLRKFDHNEKHPLRILEQIHYHSAHNPRYIQEIRHSLRETGILARESEYVTREITLKDEFLASSLYTGGYIWKNRRHVRGPEPYQTSLFGDSHRFRKVLDVTIPNRISQSISVFGEEDDEPPQTAIHTFTLSIKDLPKSLVRHAMDRNQNFRFDNLAKKFLGISSMTGFLTGTEMLGGVTVNVSAGVDSPSKLDPDELLYIVEEALRVVGAGLGVTEEAYEGSEEFEPYPIRDVFAQQIRRNYTLSNGDGEIGYAQSSTSNSYHVDLKNAGWHAYDDNYGTSEEKSFIRLLDSMIQELRLKWSDIYLLRNEGAFKIYEFATGKAFEPDYVLFANDVRSGYVNWQVFIEPKGQHLLEHDKWKEDFLRTIRSKAEVLVENRDVRVLGLPFYNRKDEGMNNTTRLALAAL